MFENERAGLFAMTLSAVLILARHRQATRWLENVSTVRVVALDAVHSTFDNRMALGQTEFRFGLEVALETAGGVFARVQDEFSAPAAGLDVLAARPMARFATGLTSHFRVG